MEYAIIHNASLNLIERHEAQSGAEAFEKYLAAHPEYECDSVSELCQTYPVLMGSLLAAPMH